VSEQEDKGQDRTEEPTEKRREDFRKKGQTAKSQDITSIGLLFTVTVVIALWATGMTEAIANFCIEILTVGIDNPSFYADDPLRVGALVLRTIVVMVGPVVAAAFVAALVLMIAQVGLTVSFKPMEPDLSKMNPITGIQQKMFSAQAVAEWIKSMLKVVIVGFVSWRMWESHSPVLAALPWRDLQGSVYWTGVLVLKLVCYTLLVMIFLAIADMIFSKWQLYRKMRMTLQELKDEHKESDGDPYRKAKMKQLMHDIGHSRLVADVQEATVVVTNPSHYAVALRYDMGQSSAPIVVAMGTDHRAKRIKEIARTAGIPRVENRPLARALYSQSKVGLEIPFGLYESVAEVLAFVYRLRASRRPGGARQEAYGA
jgi:flagellar biosynthetic protein FlhB